MDALTPEHLALPGEDRRVESPRRRGPPVSTTGQRPEVADYSLQDSDPHVAEARRGGAVAHVGDLRGLSFAAVRRAPDRPLATYGVATVPEFRRDPGVGRVFQHRAEPTAADLPGDLRTELKVQPLVVDAPAFVGLHVHAAVGIGDQVLQPPGAGVQGYVGHADQRYAVPAVGAHRAVAGLPEQGRRFA